MTSQGERCNLNRKNSAKNRVPSWRGRRQRRSCGQAKLDIVQLAFPCRERETTTQGLSTTCWVLSRTCDLQSKSDLSGNMLFSNVQGRVSVILSKLNLEMSWKKTDSLDENHGTSPLQTVEKKNYENDLSLLAWSWPFWSFQGHEQAHNLQMEKRKNKEVEIKVSIFNSKWQCIKRFEGGPDSRLNIGMKQTKGKKKRKGHGLEKGQPREVQPGCWCGMCLHGMCKQPLSIIEIALQSFLQLR